MKLKDDEMKNDGIQNKPSSDAGRRAFDQIVRKLDLATLGAMSCLDEQKRTWTTLINFCNGDRVYAQAAEHWKREAKSDCEAFAAGFFERAQQSWNLETEEYEGLDGSGQQDDSPYNSYRQVVPMSIELFQIAEWWAGFVFEDYWTFFLSGTGGDARDHRFAEFRIKQIGKLLGHERIADRIKKPSKDQAKKTPTLFRIYCSGTREERELVLRTFWAQGGSEAATEIAVAAALESGTDKSTQGATK